MKEQISKILKEKQENKNKLKELNKQLHEIENKVPFILMIKFLQIQKEIITLEKAIICDNIALEKFKDSKCN
jgi:hypothetical protein